MTLRSASFRDSAQTRDYSCSERQRQARLLIDASREDFLLAGDVIQDLLDEVEREEMKNINSAGIWATQKEELRALGSVVTDNLAFLEKLETVIKVDGDMHPAFKRLVGAATTPDAGEHAKKTVKRGKSQKSSAEADYKTAMSICSLSAKKYRVKVSTAQHPRLHKLELIEPVHGTK